MIIRFFYELYLIKKIIEIIFYVIIENIIKNNLLRIIVKINIIKLICLV